VVVAFKILMLNGPLPTGEIEGGVTRWVYELAIHLTQLGHEVHIMGYGDYVSPISIVQGGLQYHGVPNRYFGDNLLLGKGLSDHIVKLHKHYKYDLIHGHSGHHTFPAILTRKSLNVPVVTTIHAVDMDEFLTCHKEIQTIYGLKFFGPRRLCNALTHITSTFIREYFTYKYSDALVTVSQHSLRQLQELYNPSVRTYVVYGGISNKFEAEKPLKGNSSKKKLLFVGRVDPRKGLHYLIRALPLMAKDVEVVIAGALSLSGRRYQAYLRNMIAKSNVQRQVKFLGSVSEEEKWKLYSLSDLFVLPSIHEALGLVILEAMSAGLPVVASNLGGIPEVVKDGENGLLFEPRNWKDLSEKTTLLLNDDEMRERLGKNAKRSVQGMTWTKVARKYESIYENYIS
jgi:glycosyltransferase involved in cell wall biosynthesis